MNIILSPCPHLTRLLISLLKALLDGCFHDNRQTSQLPSYCLYPWKSGMCWHLICSSEFLFFCLLMLQKPPLKQLEYWVILTLPGYKWEDRMSGSNGMRWKRHMSGAPSIRLPYWEEHRETHSSHISACNLLFVWLNAPLFQTTCQSLFSKRHIDGVGLLWHLDLSPGGSDWWWITIV